VGKQDDQNFCEKTPMASKIAQVYIAQTIYLQISCGTDYKQGLTFELSKKFT
jgi:hypothetical protein